MRQKPRKVARNGCLRVLEGEKPQNWGRIVTFLLSIFDNLLMFFDNFWILEREIFEGETVRLTGDIGTMQLYEVIMEENKLDRLDLD